MTRYQVTGTFTPGRREQPFTREVDAHSERHAQETALSQLSSQHGISRANIEIESVEEAA